MSEITPDQVEQISTSTGMRRSWVEAIVNQFRSWDRVPTAEAVADIAQRATRRKDAMAMAVEMVLAAEGELPSAPEAEGSGLQVIDMSEVPELES